MIFSNLNYTIMKLHRSFLYFLALAGSAFLSSCQGPIAVSYGDMQKRMTFTRDADGTVGLQVDVAK